MPRRRTLIPLAALLVMPHGTHAQPATPAQDAPSRAPQPVSRSIAAAQRLLGTDSLVRIAGRASVAAGKLQARSFDVAVQDATGGIRVFSRTLRPTVQEGDSVEATGAIKRYRGNLELVASAIRVVEATPRVIAPRELAVDPAEVARYGGQLVRVRGRVAGFGKSEGGQWLRLRDASPARQGTLTIWVPANHGARVDLSRVHTEDSLVVTGVVTSYQDNAGDPVVWQLVPRDAADVETGAVRSGLPSWLLWALLAAAATIGAALAVGRIVARRQLHALRETEARYRQLLELSPDAVIVHAGGAILFTNRAAARILGTRNEEALVGRAIHDFLDADVRAALEESMRLAPSDGEPATRVRGRMLGNGGKAVDVELTGSPCVYHDRAAVVLLARDITAQLRYERDLHALALVDELTGLQNRRGFTLFAEQELARARRRGDTPVLLFADLDGLKTINDTHGHAAGDAAIRLVATALKSITRETDIVARWSGDELIALLGEGGEAAARSLGTRLDDAITALAPPDQPYIVSASVGTALLDPVLPLREAMERADSELYAQKKRGRRSAMRNTPHGVAIIGEPE